MMFSQCNTCSMFIYHGHACRPIRYSINGSVATSRAMPTPFYLSIMKLVSFGSSGFMYIIIMSLIIASCTPENIISKHSKTSDSE